MYTRQSSARATHSSRSANVLDKDNALGFNQEEVDEPVGIADQAVKGLARKRIVLARAELGSQAIVKDQLAGDLCRNGGGQDHPRESESPADEAEVPVGDDGRDDGDIGDGRVACTVGNQHNCTVLIKSSRKKKGAVLTRILPGKEVGEERMVGRQGLSRAAVGL